MAISAVRVDAAQGFLEAKAATPVEEPVANAEPVAQPAPAPTPSPKAAKAQATPASKDPAEVAPAAPAEVAPAPAAAPAPSKGGSMDLFATMSGGFGPARRLTVFNSSSMLWTGCTVTANDLYTYYAGSIDAGGHNGILMLKFKDAGGNLFTSNAVVNRVSLRCDQGTTAVVVPG